MSLNTKDPYGQFTGDSVVDATIMFYSRFLANAENHEHPYHFKSIAELILLIKYIDIIKNINKYNSDHSTPGKQSTQLCPTQLLYSLSKSCREKLPSPLKNNFSHAIKKNEI